MAAQLNATEPGVEGIIPDGESEVEAPDVAADKGLDEPKAQAHA